MKVERFLDTDLSEDNNLKKQNDKLKGKESGKESINNLINIKLLSNISILISLIKENKPEILEKLDILEFIDSGSECVVYKAKVKNLNKFVAIKIILRKEEQLNINEINIAKIVKNSNIIDFYFYSNIIENKLDCVILEYIKFGNLKDFQKKFIKRKFLSESLLVFLGYQILNALYYCHKCKIAHLDLKPQNIVINQFLELKLIDFSISLDYSQIKTKKIQLKCKGTKFYMAPEILASEKINASDLNKVDLFSFGVILYKFAFGKYPFNLNPGDYGGPQDFIKIKEKIDMENLEIEPNAYYSKNFVDFVKKLLEKDINKRTNIFEAINHNWIQSARILLEEKEKINNSGNFLLYLLTDHYKNFNDFNSFF